MYYEDADYCKYLTKKGIKLIVCADELILHKVSFTKDRQNDPVYLVYNTRNRFLIIRKFENRIMRPFYYFCVLISSVMSLLRNTSFANYKYYFQGIKLFIEILTSRKTKSKKAVF
jgi:GT2 family glycosyltransferase